MKRLSDNPIEEMDDKKDFINLFKPFIIPILLSLSVFGVIQYFISFEEKISWKIFSSLLLLVSLTWALWYRFSKIEEKSSIDSKIKRKVPRHRNKLLRWAVQWKNIIQGPIKSQIL
jgi:hypothetical protein